MPSEPRFRVQARLGAGGMGEVHLALMERGGRMALVALKRIRPEFADDAELVRHFDREAKVGSLLAHPHVVELLAYGRDEAGPYLAFEYVNGRAASVLLKFFAERGMTLPLPAVLAILRDATLGLAYAHGLRDEREGIHGVIHRDVTPDNVLVSYEGISKLGDFGMAKLVSGTVRTQTATLRGKYSFLAPELYEGAEASPASDAFSLAVSAFRLFTGVTPFQGRNEAEIINAVLHGAPASLAALRPDVPPEVESWVTRALSKRPEGRPERLGELVAALERALAGEPAGGRQAVTECMRLAFPPGADLLREETTRVLKASTATVPPPLAATRSRGARAWVWVGLAGVLAAGAVAVALGPRSTPALASPAAPPAPVAVASPAPAQAAPPVAPVPAPTPAPPARATAPRKHALAEAAGTLAIKVRPWARVFVDDKPRGVTPLSPLQLARGTHSVRLVNEDLKQTRVYKVEILPREQQELRVVLDDQ